MKFLIEETKKINPKLACDTRNKKMKSTSIYLAIAGLAIASPVYNAAAGSAAYAAERRLPGERTGGVLVEERGKEGEGEGKEEEEA